MSRQQNSTINYFRKAVVNTIFTSQSPRRQIISVAAAAALGFAACAARGQAVAGSQPSTDAPTAALEKKVASLEAKVATLESQQAQAQADEAAVVKEVIAEADRNTQLLSSSELVSGYDPSVGFVLRSDDGEYSLHPGLFMAFRNETTYRQSIPHGGGGETARTGDDTQSGFDLVRMRLTLDGNFTKQINYYVQFAADQGAAPSLLDAYWVYHFGSDSPLAVKVGQFKDPVWHERNLSEATLMAADRSLVENLLGGVSSPDSRVEGVSLMYDQDRLRAQAVFHHGFDTADTKFYTTGGLGAGVDGSSGVTPMDYGASTRVEYMLIGNRTSDFNPYTEYDRGFTALGDKQDILVIGGGADFSQAGSNDLLLHSADIQYDTVGGLSLYGAYYGAFRDLNANQGVTPGNYYDSGFELQAAYLVTPRVEPFVRYDYVKLDPASVTGLATDEVQEATIGVNYYLYKQNVRFTVDASWLPNGAPTDADTLGVLQDSGHNEFVFRVQLQLAL